MKRIHLRFFPVLILFLVAYNFASAGGTPTPVATASVTSVPTPGDLGFGNVTGKVADAVTGLPIANATVTCEHYSYTSAEADRCNRVTITDQDGVFLFEKIFFHDTDTIKLIVEALGYQSVEIKQAFFAWGEWNVNISLNHTP